MAGKLCCHGYVGKRKKQSKADFSELQLDKSRRINAKKDSDAAYPPWNDQDLFRSKFPFTGFLSLASTSSPRTLDAVVAPEAFALPSSSGNSFICSALGCGIGVRGEFCHFETSFFSCSSSFWKRLLYTSM